MAPESLQCENVPIFALSLSCFICILLLIPRHAGVQYVARQHCLTGILVPLMVLSCQTASERTYAVHVNIAAHTEVTFPFCLIWQHARVTSFKCSTYHITDAIKEEQLVCVFSECKPEDLLFVTYRTGSLIARSTNLSEKCLTHNLPICYLNKAAAVILENVHQGSLNM